MQYVCRHVASVATGIRLVWCKFSRGFAWDKFSLCRINQNFHTSSSAMTVAVMRNQISIAFASAIFDKDFLRLGDGGSCAQYW